MNEEQKALLIESTEEYIKEGGTFLLIMEEIHRRINARIDMNARRKIYKNKKRWEYS